MEKLNNFLLHHPVRRLKNKVGRLLRETVPRNQELRPVGVHPSSQRLAAQPQSGVRYHEVVPAHTSVLAIPDDFYALVPEYGGLHSKPNREEAVPVAFVVTLDRARLYADNLNSVAVIAQDGRLVGDASFQWTNKAFDLIGPEDNNIFRQQYFLPAQEVDGTVCSLLSGGGAGEGNYFHWLIDSLPRLHLVREAGLLDGVDFFLVYDKTTRFVLDTLGALGIRPEQLLDVTTHRHLRARRLIVTSPVRGRLTHVPAWACDFLRQSQQPAAASVTRSFGPYVYISRRDARYRYVRNEAEVEALLREYGFEAHTLSSYSQAEKTALFRQAKIIVSAIGAGLTNIVFCEQNAHLIELLPPSFVVAEYQLLAARLQMGYSFLVHPDPNASQNYRDAVFDHLTVDVAALRAQLDLVLRQQAQAAPKPAAPSHQLLAP